MSDISELSGHLIVSLHNEVEDYFANTITLIIEHSKSGAFGLVINKPLNIKFKDFLETARSTDAPQIEVLETGPVERDRLFLLHTNDYGNEQSHKINQYVSLSGYSEKILASDGMPTHIVAGFGYAGWGPGQLENELISNIWLVVPFLSEIIFEIPHEDKCNIAARSMGIDLNLLSKETGHG
ncbi:MAG: hypothetical protein CMQ40_06575 [Gammaproteobacteria bacterium]|nr:hypothetical protein [Gammaproteobacteria bacterium]